ncbi:hypothetical protein ISG32_16130 [Diaphorobacter sp. NR2-3-3-1]|nr:hypothetical protein [Diaphorobacter caeni]
MQQTATTAAAAAPAPTPTAASKKVVSAPAAAEPAAKASSAKAKKAGKPAEAKTASKAASKARKVAAKDVQKEAKEAAKEAKPKKPKLVRDSFTIPKDEYAVIDMLKLRAAKLDHPVKKSELLRAGLKLLATLDDQQLQAALKAVPAIKTGRPKA